MSGLTDRLRQVAGQATPGPWLNNNAPWRVYGTLGTIDPIVADTNDTLDTRHIATFDPVLVGAMLDVIDAAEAAVYEDDDATYVALRDVLARFREVAG